MTANTPTQAAAIDIEDLADNYDAVLLDAYGVLVDGTGALPWAAGWLRSLRDRQRAFFIVTNDASRLPATAAARFQALGLDAEPDQFITSGSLLVGYFAANSLRGARCFVLGPADSHRYVELAGGISVPHDPGVEIDAMVVCDDAGYPFLETVDIALSVLYRQADVDRTPRLILPNPDLVYPKDIGTFGFTSGAVALLLEAALDRRYPETGLRFARLGKPFPPIFEEAIRRAGSTNIVMVGDQLETDIAGAEAAGIDAVLTGTGITRIRTTP